MLQIILFLVGNSPLATLWSGVFYVYVRTCKKRKGGRKEGTFPPTLRGEAIPFGDDKYGHIHKAAAYS